MLWGTKNFLSRFNSHRINSATIGITFKFTAVSNMTVDTLNFYIRTVVGSPPNLTVQLQNDLNGSPSGILRSTTVAPSAGFLSANITNYTLVQGSIYYITILGATGYDGSNYVDIIYSDQRVGELV